MGVPTAFGTTTLFAALDVATGKVIGQCMKRHRHQEWLKLLRRIDAETLPHLDVHLIADNYATRKHAKVKAWLKRIRASTCTSRRLEFLAQPGRALLRPRCRSFAEDAMANDFRRYYHYPTIFWLSVGDWGDEMRDGPAREAGFYIKPFCDPMCCRPAGPFITAAVALAWARQEARKIQP
jgi:hypothetical protein